VKYKLETYSLNHIWYKEYYEVEANSKEEATQKVKDFYINSEGAELVYSKQVEVENTRAEFNVESIQEED